MILESAHMTLPTPARKSRRRLIDAAVLAVLFAAVPFPRAAEASDVVEVAPPFHYPFTVDGRLEESGLTENSSSPYWWASSGGYMTLKDGRGSTIHGDLPLNSRWRELYARNSPIDTDGGLHPQNIFRMTTRDRWRDVAQEMSFRIERTNMSASLRRGPSNGLWQMSRYADHDNLYYSGVRVDGLAVIKKKYRGRYYTLAKTKVVSGWYDRTFNPNLLPEDTWIRLRTTTRNLDTRRVLIRLEADFGATGTWKKLLEVVDDGSLGGGALLGSGSTGIRTDFMDVTFDDFVLTKAW